MRRKITLKIEITEQSYTINKTKFKLKRVTNLDDLVDQVSDEDFNEDERLPYWAELWPSAIALSRFILNNSNLIEGKSILELGCGLGLTTLTIASLKNASFLATDYEQDALDMLKENFNLNNMVAPDFKLLDWRKPDINDRYDLIIASDILYEERFFSSLQQLMDNHLSPNGSIIIAEPNRPIAKHFFVKLLKAGYSDTIIDKTVEQDGHKIKISIHRLQHQ
jgi:predicted nicotinamide N-methyase